MYKKTQINQILWMKWVDEPIVAKSKILSFHSGEIKNSEINEANSFHRLFILLFLSMC